MLTPGDLEVTVGDSRPSTEARAAPSGFRAISHTVNNRGTTPVEVIVVRIK
jgi:hypothetical protein